MDDIDVDQCTGSVRQREIFKIIIQNAKSDRTFWKIKINQLVNEYFQEILKYEDVFGIPFPEAGLIIQGASKIYDKNVKKLEKDIIQLHNTLSYEYQRRKQEQELRRQEELAKRLERNQLNQNEANQNNLVNNVSTVNEQSANVSENPGSSVQPVETGAIAVDGIEPQVEVPKKVRGRKKRQTKELHSLNDESLSMADFLRALYHELDEHFKSDDEGAVDSDNEHNTNENNFYDKLPLFSQPDVSFRMKCCEQFLKILTDNEDITQCIRTFLRYNDITGSMMSKNLEMYEKKRLLASKMNLLVELRYEVFAKHTVAELHCSLCEYLINELYKMRELSVLDTPKSLHGSSTVHDHDIDVISGRLSRTVSTENLFEGDNITSTNNTESVLGNTNDNIQSSQDTLQTSQNIQSSQDLLHYSQSTTNNSQNSMDTENSTQCSQNTFDNSQNTECTKNCSQSTVDNSQNVQETVLEEGSQEILLDETTSHYQHVDDTCDVKVCSVRLERLKSVMDKYNISIKREDDSDLEDEEIMSDTDLEYYLCNRFQKSSSNLLTINRIKFYNMFALSKRMLRQKSFFRLPDDILSWKPNETTNVAMKTAAKLLKIKKRESCDLKTNVVKRTILDQFFQNQDLPSNDDNSTQLSLETIPLTQIDNDNLINTQLDDLVASSDEQPPSTSALMVDSSVFHLTPAASEHNFIDDDDGGGGDGNLSPILSYSPQQLTINTNDGLNEQLPVQLTKESRPNYTWMEDDVDPKRLQQLPEGDILNKIAERMKRYQELEAQKVEIAKRVEKWRQFIEPRLQESQNRREFDIHEYEDRILDQLPTNSEQSTPFSDIIAGKSREEIARNFLACLQLANTNNIQITQNSTEPLQVNCMHIRKLSSIRHYQSFDGNLERLKMLNKIPQTSELIDESDILPSNEPSTSKNYYSPVKRSRLDNCKIRVRPDLLRPIDDYNNSSDDNEMPSPAKRYCYSNPNGNRYFTTSTPILNNNERFQSFFKS